MLRNLPSVRGMMGEVRINVNIILIVANNILDDVRGALWELIRFAHQYLHNREKEKKDCVSLLRFTGLGPPFPPLYNCVATLNPGGY